MKYEITNIVHPENPNLKKIRALRDIPKILKNEIGVLINHSTLDKRFLLLSLHDFALKEMNGSIVEINDYHINLELNLTGVIHDK